MGAVRSVLSLLIGTALVLVANGLLTTVLGTRLAVGGQSLGLAGVVVSAFSVGLVLGSWRGRWVVERVGHIRTFAAFAGLATAAALGLALVDVPALWVGFRVVQGFAIGGNYLVIESWLSERSSSAERGRMLAVYVATCQVALAAGQLLVVVQPPTGSRPFILGALLYVLALVPIALTRTPQPVLIEGLRASLGGVLRRAPVAVGGCFVAGCTTGSLLNLGPAFGTAEGLSSEQVAVFMASSVLGGLALQWPVGWLADRIDRRVVIELIATASCGAALLLWSAHTFPTLTAAAFALGAVAFVLYPVAIAHAHDLVDRADVVATSGTLVLAYGLGSAFVPLIGSVGLEVFGSPTLPALLTLFNLALVALAVIRLVKRRRLPVVEPVPFAPLALPQVVATRDSLLSVEEDTTDPQAVSSTRAARGPS
ncbi:MAG: MFS transporter [Myxococcales bacterium]|nr:MFS transporter [Myxococcales bacterium]